MSDGQVMVSSLSSEIEQTRSAIRASAGSGKTFTLTNYYLRSLLNGALPQNLLATTFTRNAAGEIFGRVLLRLSDACESDEKFAALNNDLKLNLTRQQGVENLLGLCRALHQVRISTIDAFFGQMLRGYTHDIGLPSSMQLVNEDSPEAQSLQYEAIRTMLEGSQREQFLQLLDGLESGRAKRTVTESLMSQFNSAHELFQNSPEHAWESVASTQRVLSAVELEMAIQALETESQNWVGVPGYIKQPLILKDIDKVRQSDWPKFLDTGLGAKVATGENYYKKPIPEELAQAYQPLVDHAQGILLLQHLGRTQALYRALKEYDQHYSQLRLRAGMLFFRDVPRLLANLLPQFSPGEIEHRLDARVTHLLLDEFQDTTPEQYAILKPFATRIADMPVEQGLFFCVGDLKQSIYGWRGATPEIFNRLQGEFPAVSWKDSNRSFRSSPVILEAVNQLFSGLPHNPIVQEKCPAAVAIWGEYFQAHEAVHQTLSGYVELLQSPEWEEGEAEATEGADDGAEVTNKSSAHLDFAATYVQKITRQAPGATVGVLMRSNNKAREMLHLLQQRGVRATGEMGVSIAADPAIALVLSALQFSRHPADTAAKFHLLHSPLAQVLHLRGGAALPDGEAARKIRHQLAQSGLGGTIHFWAKILTPHGDRESALRLVQLMELADSFRGDDTAQFMDTVAKHEAPQSVPAQVQVMTVHKSKGLEFDAVVLPELHGSLEKSDKFLLSRDPQTQAIRKICVWPNQMLRSSQPALEEMYQEHFTTRMNEAFCTLYVAMTRAKHALYMIVPPLGLDSKGNAKKSPFTFASMLRAGLGGEEALTNPDLLQEPIKVGDALWHQHLPSKKTEVQPNEDIALPFKFTAPPHAQRHLKTVTPSSHDLGYRAGVSQLLQAKGTSYAKQRGLQLHQLLEQVEWLEENTEPYSLLDKEGNRECFVKPVLQAGQQAQVWREQRFSVIVDDTFIQGTFDRVVLVTEGNLVKRATLYDFKTGSDDTPLLDDYTRQMEEYRKALSHMLQLEPALITCQLQFIDSGKSVVI